MARRINKLGDSTDHLTVLGGRALDADEDGVLQEIVRNAATALQAPIGLVSLVLRRTQFFRAAHGLPLDLSVAQGTDRDASFCQFVVASGREFIVTDARNDPRVPTDLVDRYGIEAYLGCPVEVGGQVVGSVCVIDTVPRDFAKADVETLTALAKQASARLTVLSDAPSPEVTRVRQAAGPAFGEIRNALVAVASAPAQIDIAVLELKCVVRLGDPSLTAEERDRVAGALTGATRALDDLHELSSHVAISTRRIVNSVCGLENLLASKSGGNLATSMGAADQLAHHITKLVGGVAWEPVSPTLRVRVPQSVVVAILAAGLIELGALPGESALTATVEIGEDAVLVLLGRVGASPESVQAVAQKLAHALRDEPMTLIQAADQAVAITFPLYSLG